MKIYAVLGAVIVIAAGAYVLVRETNDTSAGKLTGEERKIALEKMLGREATLEEKTADQSWVTQTNKVMSFAYPARARVYTEDNEKAMSNPNAVENFGFALLSEHLQANVQVNKTEVTELSELSGVKMRLMQSKDYVPLEIKMGDTAGQGFGKNGDGYEKTAFVLIDGYSISVSVSGYSEEAVDKLFTPLLTSVKIF